MVGEIIEDPITVIQRKETSYAIRSYLPYPDLSCLNTLSQDMNDNFLPIST
ncbi:hypothetical protein A2U01_0096307, partial [Trifolium medium]|nr:hypothetical protein [Trifolium medium]